MPCHQDFQQSSPLIKWKGSQQKPKLVSLNFMTINKPEEVEVKCCNKQKGKSWINLQRSHIRPNRKSYLGTINWLSETANKTSVPVYSVEWIANRKK